jgi:hypothetical protein
MGRFLRLGLAVALLAGCEGAQTGAVPQGANAVAQAHRASSSSGDLLYISDHGADAIVMLTYPGGQLVGSFSPPYLAWNLCSDSSGNVWIPSEEAVFEYAHGGTTPIQTLSAAGLLMNACAVDPGTGDLAVTGEGHYGTPTLAIWPDAQGTPTTYTLPFRGWSASYDDSGNLFVDGDSDSEPFGFAELPKGGSSFVNITLDQPAKYPGNVQWDGKYIAIGARNPTKRGQQGHVVYRVHVSGSSGHVAQTVVLQRVDSVLGSWIEGDTIIAVHSKVHGYLSTVGFWKYPQGGKDVKEINGFSEAWGITISVAPSDSRIRK